MLEKGVTDRYDHPKYQKAERTYPMRNGRPYYRVSNVFCPWAKYRPDKKSINDKESDLLKKLNAATAAQFSGK